jgi:hypothetical protein
MSSVEERGDDPLDAPSTRRGGCSDALSGRSCRPTSTLHLGHRQSEGVGHVSPLLAADARVEASIAGWLLTPSGRLPLSQNSKGPLTDDCPSSSPALL